jgi:simple sugar transport system permease protein
MSAEQTLPRWADLVLLPIVCLMVALLVAAGVVALVGQNPAEVIAVLVHGAFGTARGFSYTLYYATTFVFTGLAVAVAFHGGLFNIGGEGHAAADAAVRCPVWHDVGRCAGLFAGLPG